MIYLFLADGFETIEALAPLDMMRRASVEVQSVGVTGDYVMSSHGISVKSDISLNQANFDDLEGIVLPGGINGTINLEDNQRVHDFIDYAFENRLLIASICAAPSILANKGLLNHVSATAFPDFKRCIPNYSDKYIVSDKNFITARGAGVSTSFGLEIVKYLKGDVVSTEVRNLIQWEK